MLVAFVSVYLMISISIGIAAARRVNTTKDYVTAGRQLPLMVVVAMVFATWFGAETLLGMPASFIAEDLGALISDPFGAAFCLIFFGLFLARPLYRKNLLTLGDFYRNRFSQPVEISVSIAIAISYLGWVSAQVTALGLVFNILSLDTLPVSAGIVLGAAIVLLYTLFGGMWSVAITTFIQMIVIVAGLFWITHLVSEQTGGFKTVWEHALNHNKFNFWPDANFAAIVTFVAGFLTMALGSIPQQDVFQRANSAKNEKIAVWGTVIGGVTYFFFAAIPIYLAYSAFIIAPEMSAQLSQKDPQLVLPSLILNHLPVSAQIIFFGALLSVIMSTASGTLLAPSVTLSENVLKPLLLKRHISDLKLLKVMRFTLFGFAVLVTAYALWANQSNTSIHELVQNAYKVTLVVALVPLIAGIYWPAANNNGALWAIIIGCIAWGCAEMFLNETALPAHFYGFFAAIIGMLAGSLLKPTSRLESA
ncbi:sodium:solute symporter family protein [Aliikangiella sp. IMCC44653]